MRAVSLLCASLLLLLLGAGLSGCDGPSGTPDAGRDAGSRRDASFDAGPPPPAFPKELPPSAALGAPRGQRLLRAIVHLHSPLSHDACDGEGWVDGALADPECLVHFREALCALRIDVAMATDHSPHVNEVSFEEALWIHEGDEPITDAEGNVVANRIVCPSGHRVLYMAGSENTYMPLGLSRHPVEGTVEEIGDAYDASDPAALEAFRAAGGLVWTAHTEQQTAEHTRLVDGLEIYNLHANVAPDIRTEHLDLGPLDFSQILRFGEPRFGLEPDLAVMAFLAPNEPSLAMWDQLLSEGLRPSGTGGCDAHENALPMILSDGERADSYRRMMRWITNLLVVPGDAEVTPATVLEALAAGRILVTHEVFGSPIGVDFAATDAAGASYEMGAEAPLGAELVLARPALPEGFPADPAPTLTLRILRVTPGDPSGAVEVARASDAELRFVAEEAGVYRGEVRMVPEHTRPYLGADADRLIVENAWVYTNPIWVVAP